MTINVTPLNDSPRISDNVYVQIDSGPQTINNLVTVGPANEQATQGFIDIGVDSYDNAALFSVPPAFDASGVLTFTPAPGKTGLSHVVFHAVDDGTDDHCNGEYNSLNATFTIEVMTVPIRPGDLIVADRGPYLGTGTILVLSSNDTTPGTYTQRILTTALKDPYGIALDTNGDILVADYQTGRGAGGGGLFRLDRYTLAQTTVSIGGGFVTPFGVAVDHYDGTIYVADADANSLAGAVYKIDPIAGTQTEVATGFYWLRGITVDDYDGSVFLTDVGSATPGSETLYIMDPSTYALDTFSTGQHFRHPDGMAVNDQSGAVYVAEALGKSILAADCGCDPATNQTVISTGLPVSGGSLFRLPTHVAYDAVSGNLFVTDAVASDPLPAASERRLIQVDPLTGLATQLSSGGYFEQPRGIVVVPPSNFPSL
jgi:DNA-binding beta-propeller fold protein YncE